MKPFVSSGINFWQGFSDSRMCACPLFPWQNRHSLWHCQISKHFFGDQIPDRSHFREKGVAGLTVQRAHCVPALFVEAGKRLHVLMAEEVQKLGQKQAWFTIKGPPQ